MPQYTTQQYVDRLREIGVEPREAPLVPVPLKATWNAILNPLETLKGATVNTAGNILSGIGQMLGAPFASNITLGERALRTLNIATMGILGMYRHHLEETYDPRYPESTPKYDTALLKTVGDLLPIRELQIGFTGRIPETQEIVTPEQYGENVMSAVLKILPITAATKLVGAFVFRNGRAPVKVPRLPKTIAEMEKAPNTMSEYLRKGGAAKIDVDDLPEPLKDALHDTWKATGVKLSPEEMLDVATKLGIGEGVGVLENLTPTQIYTIGQKISNNLAKLAKADKGAFEEFIVDLAMRKAARGGGRKVNYLADLVRGGVLDPEAIANIFQRTINFHGISPDDALAMYETIASSFEATGARSGQTLNAIAKASLRLFDEAQLADPKTQGLIQAFKKSIAATEEAMTPYARFTAGYKRWLRWARGSAVGQMATFSRNTIVQGLNGLVNIWEDAIADTFRYTVGNAIVPGGLKASEAYAQTLHNLTLVKHTLGGAIWRGRAISTDIRNMLGPKVFGSTYEAKPLPKNNFSLYTLFDEVLDAVHPGERALIEGSPFADISLQAAFHKTRLKALKDTMKSGDVGIFNKIATGLDWITDAVTTANRVAEMEFRRFFFLRELHKGAREAGYSTLDDFLDALKSGETSTSHRWIGELPTPELAKKRIDQLMQHEDDIAYINVSKKLKDISPQLTTSKGREAVYKAIEKEKLRVRKQVEEVKGMLDNGVDLEVALYMLDDTILGGLLGYRQTATSVVANAVDSALRATFAYTPQSGLSGSMLKMFNDFPYLYTVTGMYFPRFLTNMWSWINSRNPAMISKMFNPNLFYSVERAARKGTTVGVSTQALDDFARFTDGVVMTALAKFVRETEAGGPKYYQFYTGFRDENDNKIFADVRSYQPFAQILFLTDVIGNILRGDPPLGNLTSAEAIDAVAGLRRLQDSPVFSLTDIVRSGDYEDPTTFIRSLKKVIGTPAAMIFTPLRTIVDLMSAAGIGESWGEVKDIMGNELLGPTLQSIPGLAEALPTQIDPFTGEKITNEDPLKRQLLGLTLQNPTQFQLLLQESRFSMGDLIGSWKTREANELIRRNIGEILSTRTASGQTFGDVLTAAIRRSTDDLPIGYKREVLRNSMATLRAWARMRATLQNPHAFAQEKVPDLPEPLRDIVSQKIQQSRKRLESRGGIQ